MKVYQPRITVSLIKVIERTDVGGAAVNGPAARYREIASQTIDLTPYLGDMGSVHVSKGVNEPAGAFSISFADKPSATNALPKAQYMESMYGLVEPMDLIEIRMAREPHKYAKQKKLPIVMRGFVSEVRREQGMGPDGRPFRRVTIAGQDYGKILQLLQIIYINNQAIGDNMMHGFDFFAKYHVDTANNPSVKGFIEQVTNLILQKFVSEMPWAKKPGITSPFTKITPEVSVPGRISGPLVNAWPGGGPVYQLLALVCDVSTGWNEMFVHDREDDVALVLRPTPFIRPDGSLIPPADAGWFAPESLQLDEDIVAISSTRSDDAVANFFWVRHPRFLLTNDADMRLQSQPLPITNHPNCDPALYGIRMLDTMLNVGSPEDVAGDGPHFEVEKKQTDVEHEWRAQKLEILKEASWDSVLFERGMMRLKGDETIRAGAFMNLKMGDVSSRVYVTRVDHEFSLYQGFFTAIQYDRGTGFVARAAIQKAPFYKEMNAEGVYFTRV